DRFNVGGVRGRFEAPTPVVFFAAVGLGSLAAPLLVLVMVRVRRGTLADLGLTLRGLPAEVTRGTTCYLAMVPLVFVAMFLSRLLCRHLDVPFTEHPLLKDLEREHDATAVLALVAVAGVIAPISEEILFRGF